MQEYKIYLLGSDGHIQRRVDFFCENLEAAKKRAEQLVDGHDVELWDRSAKIATFRHHDKS